MEISKRSTFFIFLLTFKSFFSLSTLCIFLMCNEAISHEISSKTEISEGVAQSQQPIYELLQNQVEIESFLEPRISVVNASNEQVAIKNFRGKFILLYFFATWCSSCSEELKGLDKLKDSINFLDVDDFVIIPISEDYKDSAYIKSYYDRLRIKNLDFYLDLNKQAMGLLGVKNMPTTVLIDHRGNIFTKIDKNVNWSKKEIIADIMNLLEQKRIQSKEILSKKQYDLKQDQDIIFHKDTSKKVTIIN